LAVGEIAGPAKVREKPFLARGSDNKYIDTANIMAILSTRVMCRLKYNKLGIFSLITISMKPFMRLKRTKHLNLLNNSAPQNIPNGFNKLLKPYARFPKRVIVVSEKGDAIKEDNHSGLAR